MLHNQCTYKQSVSFSYMRFTLNCHIWRPQQEIEMVFRLWPKPIPLISSFSLCRCSVFNKQCVNNPLASSSFLPFAIVTTST